MGYNEVSLLQLIVDKLAAAVNAGDEEKISVLSVAYQRVKSASVQNSSLSSVQNA
jgi:hypothetical protein